jgi:hypothetical protein
MRNLTRSHSGLALAALLVVAPGVFAQQAPSHDAPSPADLEPGVNTSAPPPPDTSPPAGAPASKAAATSKPATSPAGSARQPKGTAAAKADVSPKPDVASKADIPTGDEKSRVAKDGAEGAKKGSGKAQDHLQLDTTDITGNQELPKVLYIVPWKRSDLGDLLGRPANSLLDEVLQPVDRDVFRRENRYYDALKPDAAAAGDNSATGAGQTPGDKH